MGWDFTRGASKSDIVNDLIVDQPRTLARTWSNAQQKFIDLDYDYQVTTLAFKVVKKTLWAVKEVTRYKSTGTEVERYIGCYLLDKDKSCKSWGYKDMDESMGPFYFDCPLAYLDMVPEVNGPWREKVRQWHAQQNRNIVFGKRYRLVDCKVPEVTISSIKPLRGMYNGVVYRLNPQIVGEEV